MMGPRYDLKEVKGLVERGCFEMTRRVKLYLLNHGYDSVAETLARVVASMGEGNYYKTDELRAVPGTYADIYRGVVCDDVEWYVKLFVQGGKPIVQVWSLKEDGYGF